MGTLGTMALSVAQRWQGLPYVWAGTGPKGYDCSGLTQAAWKLAGVNLPRTSQEQANAGTAVPLSQAQPGDLVLFSYPGETDNPAPANHVGLYVNPSTIFAASKPGVPIGFAPLDVAHLYKVVRPGGGATPASGAAAASASLSTTMQPVSDQPAAQLAGYQAVVNLTPWGLPLNPLKLPGFLGGKLGSLAGSAGSGIIGGVITGVVDALGPLLLTIVIAGGGLTLIVLGLWRAGQPAREKAAAAKDQVTSQVGQVAAVAAL